MYRIMQQTCIYAKDFLIEFEGDRYDIYATDFKQNDRQYVQLKANRHD